MNLSPFLDHFLAILICDFTVKMGRGGGMAPIFAKLFLGKMIFRLGAGGGGGATPSAAKNPLSSILRAP